MLIPAQSVPVAFFILIYIGNIEGNAQIKISLDSCRTLALKNNKELKISKKEKTISHLQKKVARTHYFPKISGIASYIRNEKEIALLSDEQKQRLSHLGTSSGKRFQKAGGAFAMKHPELIPLIQEVGQMVGAQLVPALDQLGNSLVNDLRTDTRNMYIGAINFTQPLFLGGKIVSYNRIAKYMEEIAGNKNQLLAQEILVATDEAYWRIVSLSHKRKLAESYVELLKKMDDDINKMIKEGVATKADGLTVRVKLNEAEMKLSKAENGLELSKLALSQICGIPLSEPIELVDEEQKKLEITSTPIQKGTSNFFEKRLEIKSLALAKKAKEEHVKVVRSEFLPKVALSGNYLVSNPSSFNGFEKKFKGMWSIGLQVKIPILNWGEGRHKIAIAKAEAEIMDYKLEEAKEKIILQVNQAEFKFNEAQKQLVMTTKNVVKAEENLRYAKLGFKEGVIPASAVLKAQTAWFNATSDKIDAQISLKLSRIALEKALGILEIQKNN